MEYPISHQSAVTLSHDWYELAEVAMRVLTATMSAFDHEVNAHAHRTAQLAGITVRQLGQAEEQQHLIRLAALLHDVGKLGIPDAIRHKPGPLTEDEWAVMRLHPEIGGRILERVGGVFRTLAIMVVAHHERWDGQGYPLRLKGDEIPLGARILSVVDSYDAMTSCRPYREAFSVNYARTELQHAAGHQYDPCVVEAFLCSLDMDEREIRLFAEQRDNARRFDSDVRVDKNWQCSINS